MSFFIHIHTYLHTHTHIYLVCMFCLHESLCTMYMSGAHGDLTMVLNPLGQELQMVVTHVSVGNQTQVF